MLLLAETFTEMQSDYCESIFYLIYLWNCIAYCEFLQNAVQSRNEPTSLIFYLNIQFFFQKNMSADGYFICMEIITIKIQNTCIIVNFLQGVLYLNTLLTTNVF